MEASSTIWGPSSARFLGCADLDVLRISLVVLSEGTIIEIESDPIFHTEQHEYLSDVGHRMTHRGQEGLPAIVEQSATCIAFGRARETARP